jgi:hypothetical protein
MADLRFLTHGASESHAFDFGYAFTQGERIGVIFYSIDFYQIHVKQ